MERRPGPSVEAVDQPRRDPTGMQTAYRAQCSTSQRMAPPPVLPRRAWSALPLLNHPARRAVVAAPRVGVLLLALRLPGQWWLHARDLIRPSPSWTHHSD